MKNLDAFMKKMHRLLEQKNNWTSQELFVVFHIAFMYMYDRDLSNVNDRMIYWEPHYVGCNILEDCVQWLGTEKVPCDIMNVVWNLL